MYKLEVKTSLKKYAKMDGYVANTYSPYAFLTHLAFRFNIPMYELKKHYHKNKITLVWR